MSENADSYKLPTIEFERRGDLINFLQKNPVSFVFENLEEVCNPVGLQWNLTISTKVNSQEIGQAVVTYHEALFEKPDKDTNICALWLQEACPFIINYYRGVIKS